MSLPKLTHVTSIELKYRGDCSLLGVSDDLRIHAEEIYSDDAWIAQHIYTLDGAERETVDEDFGKNKDVKPLHLSGAIERPHPGWHCMGLNYSGPRHRGLRGPERIVDTVQPLSIGTRMTIQPYLRVKVAPPALLGIAESYVISEAELIRPNLYLVCRRIRVAYALSPEQIDENDGEFDYDTTVIYAVHLHDRQEGNDPALEDIIGEFGGITVHRPMDCVYAFKHLFIADGGSEANDIKSKIHVWRVETPQDTAKGESHELDDNDIYLL